mmetsp:Transcript_1268/g.3097  ORF Transcript_1268/g.3097 Transcript_1268/m.3097 type:complete len:276 (+) Transcript_1268:102-929(+)
MAVNISRGNDGRNSDELPLRYVCQLCGVCIATSESLLDTRDDVVLFNHLYGSASVDKGTKTVMCPFCEQALGTRGDNTFFLRKERVVKRLERLEILVCSLKQQEIAELTPVLQEVFPRSNITPRILQKAELRGFQLAGARPSPDLVVIVHRNEGRVLLTDRNGFYHDVLGSAWQLTRGNVLVVLTRTELKADTELYDTQLLRSLSTQGDQPTIGAISAVGRVLTWESSPSKPQREQLQMLTSKAYFREPPPIVQGIPGQWSGKPQKNASNWCNLL